MSGTNWQCPHCNRFVTINFNRQVGSTLYLEIDNALGDIACNANFIVCPNPDCVQPTLTVSLAQWKSSPQGRKLGNLIEKWRLYPAGSARPFPDYIPAVIRNDYVEACQIVELSPKASATLSRRCLQGMLRDFWRVTPGNLWQEILQIEDKTDGVTWSAINAVREIGNIGAHMQKDMDVIVEVDPGEAEMLIQLVETLLTEWYVARHDRGERMKAITVAAAAKKQPAATPPSPE